MQNSAIKLLQYLACIAAAMTTAHQEQEEIREFLRKDAKENPKPPRAPKLFRQYQKRYS